MKIKDNYYNEALLEINNYKQEWASIIYFIKKDKGRYYTLS